MLKPGFDSFNLLLCHKYLTLKVLRKPNKKSTNLSQNDVVWVFLYILEHQECQYQIDESDYHWDRVDVYKTQHNMLIYMLQCNNSTK